jgi:hypothetical protein
MASDTTNPDRQYAALLQEYKNGKKDSAFLHDLAMMAVREKDGSNVSIISKDYIIGLKNVYSKNNLSFILKFTKRSIDTGFTILIKNMNKVSNVIGENQVEPLLRSIIGKEEIEPYLVNKALEPDWDKILVEVKEKYGAIGEEKVYGAQMIYFAGKENWEKFGKYYALYYSTAIPRSEYHINNISWTVFEHVKDLNVLNVAIKATYYSLENFAKDDPGDMDTHANLLYKAGRTKDAIEVEKKAVQLSENRKELVETLDKMEKGIPTWY